MRYTPSLLASYVAAALELASSSLAAQPIMPSQVLQSDLPTMADPGRPSADAAKQAASSKTGKRRSSGQVTLNFVNADIESVVKAVGQATDRNILVDPRAKGTLTLVTEQPVSRAQALNALSSVLRMQGFALVESGGFSKVVPESDAKLQGSPLAVGKVSAHGEQIVTQVFRLDYESANNLVPLLRPLVAPNNTITAYPANNTLVITDYADNLQRLSRIIAAIDAPVSGDVEVISLQHALAVDVAALLTRMLDPSSIGNSDATLKTTVMAEPRSNSLLIRASSVARVQQARMLVARLDQPTTRAGNIWVVPLKNADAAKLAITLRALVAADGTMSSAGASGGVGGAPGASAAPATPIQSSPSITSTTTSGGTGSTTGGMGNGVPGSFAQSNLPTTGGIVQADTSTNSLIITANERVYRNLRDVIERLDTRRAQIYIESMIVEVQANKAAEFGVQWRGLLSSNGSVTLPNVDPSSGSVLAGKSLTWGNGTFGLAALARALDNQSGVNVLSAPNLLTLDNEEAKILIGQNVGLANSQSYGSATTAPFTTFDRKDVGLTLRVKPQISESGLIKLQIYQETSSIIAATANTSNIILNKRVIESNVLAEDGQVIALGGLMEDSFNEGVEKIPLLGDVPVLGALFRYENNKRNKTNLMVFLRPYVIRSSAQNDTIVTDRYDLIRGTQQNYESPNWIVRERETPVIAPLASPKAPLIELGPRPTKTAPAVPSTTLLPTDTQQTPPAQFIAPEPAKTLPDKP